MKNTVFGILLIGLLAACSTPPAPQVQADATVLAKTFPERSGTWHFSDQSWNNGIHFCEYRSGSNKVLTRIETFESCPSQVDTQ